MKLKDNITIDQLEELGFRCGFSNSSYKGNEDEIVTIDCNTNEIKIMCYNTIFCVPNILLKMFEVGYIEESED